MTNNDCSRCILESKTSEAAHKDMSPIIPGMSCSEAPTKTRKYWPTIMSFIPVRFAVLVSSLACWMPAVVCLNDKPTETWSIARLNRMKFLIVN